MCRSTPPPSSALILDRVSSVSRSDVGNLVAVGVGGVSSECMSIMQRVNNLSASACILCYLIFFACAAGAPNGSFPRFTGFVFHEMRQTRKTGCCVIVNLMRTFGLHL